MKKRVYKFTLQEFIATCVATAHNADYSAIDLQMPFDISEVRRNNDCYALEVDADFSDEGVWQNGYTEGKDFGFQQGMKAGRKQMLADILDKLETMK